jgi:WD40 repeat protein
MMRILSLLTTCLFSCLSSWSQHKQVLPIGHTSGINIATFSDDSKFLLTSSEDMTIKLWQVPTGIMVADMRTGGSWYRAAGFVPGGKYAFASSDKLYLWNLRDASLLRTFDLVLPVHSTYSFSPDGSKVIGYTYSDSVMIYNIETGKKLLAMHAKDLNGVNFSPDGEKFIVYYGRTADVQEFNSSNGEATSSFKAGDAGIYQLVYHPDGTKLLVSSYDKSLSLWKTNGTQLHTLSKFPDGTANAFITKDGNYVMAAQNKTYGDTSVSVWDVESGKLQTTLSADLYNHTLTAGNYSSILRKLIFPGKELYKSNLLMMHQIDAPAEKKTLSGHTTYIRYASFSNDGKYFVTASYDKSARLYKGNGSLLAELKGKTRGEITKVSFSPGGKYLFLNNYEISSVWNVNDGTFVPAFQPGKDVIWQLKTTTDGKHLLTIPKTGEVKIWDANSQALVHSNLRKDIQAMSVFYQGTFRFTTDNKRVFLSNHDGTAFMFDVASGKKLMEYKHGDWISRSAVSTKGEYVATNKNDSIKIWNGITGALISKFGLKKDYPPDSLVFSSSGETIAACYGDNPAVYTLKGKTVYDPAKSDRFYDIIADKDLVLNVNDKGIQLINLNTGKVMQTIVDDETDMWGSKVAKQYHIDKELLVYKCNYSVKVIDIKSRKLLAEFKSYDVPFAYTVNKEQTEIAIGYSNGLLRIWRLADSKMIYEIRAHDRAINDLSYFPTERKLVSVSADNTAKVWNTATGKQYYTFFPLNNKDYFLQDTSGYYMCTQAASKLLYYVTQGLKVITFDQLDSRYNRPDKVLEASGSQDTMMISSYRKAYQKRIKRLGIDTSLFQKNLGLPETEIINSDAISYDQRSNTLQLRLSFKDSSYLLDRFNVWVNESPLFSSKGIFLKNKKVQKFDTTISLRLSSGINRIESSVININGTESFRHPLQVNYTPTSPAKEQLHFIGIGINKFKDDQYNLAWSVKDIRDLAIKLKEKNPYMIIDTLFDEHVTKTNIIALKEKLLKLQEDDKVIVSYSGHGLLSKELDYYLSTYNVNFNKPDEQGLAYDEMENLLDGIKPRKKLMLIDACHSGEVDKEEIAKIEAAKTKLDSLGTNTKSNIKITSTKKVGMTNSFELMQNLFVNVSRGTGATIISAAGGMQYAQERGDLKNGVFTYSIIDAFNNNHSLSVAELKNIVSEAVLKLTNGLQKPTSRNETNTYDWLIW